MRASRTTGRAVIAVVGMLALTACTPGAAEPSASPTTATAPSPTPTPTQDDEALILEAYEGFWAAVVTLFSGNVDRSLFEGVATGVIVEKQVNEAEFIVQNDLRYQGQPTFTDVSVVVDGDTAVVAACVDSSTWHPTRVPPEGNMVLAGAVQVDRIDGEWLVTDSADAPESLVC